MDPKLLSDPDLVSAVARLATAERRATAVLVAHLVELHARRLHVKAGCGSLFTYCTQVLRLSESEAYDRTKAAKVARRYPKALELLAQRRLSLTTLRLLAPHLTRDNQAALVTEACGKNKREVLELLARWFPQPDVATSIRAVPMPPVVAVPWVPTAPTVSVSVTAPPPQPARPLVTPLAPERYHISFTGDAETKDLLELARDLLRHAVPTGDAASIFNRSLRALVEQLVRDKYAATSAPRDARGGGDGRHIPAEVKRQVFLRDRGRCVFTSADGRTCGERALVEFHHVRPFAAGGTATVDNIELRCRAHNALEAELFFAASRVGEAPAPYEYRVTRDTFSFRNENPYDRSRCTVSSPPSSSPRP